MERSSIPALSARRKGALRMSDKYRHIPPIASPDARFDERRAAQAYEAHVALLDQERRFPQLKNNPAWQCLRADAYESFALAFGGEA